MNLKKTLLSFLFSLVFLSVKILYSQPIITNFNPSKGQIGVFVTISGFNFNINASKNIVFFGATKAKIVSATNSELVVEVPSGATYSKISLLDTDSRLIKSSDNYFLPIYTPNANNILTSDFEDLISLNAPDPYDFTIADLDDDGKSDIVVSNIGSNSISIYRNTSIPGNISFSPKIDYVTESFPTSVAIDDLNGDGSVDLVITNTVSGSISIFKNTSSIGSISFSPKIDIFSGSDTRTASVKDIDLDGRLDIVTVNYNSNTLSIFKNISFLGDIYFEPKIDLITSNNPRYIGVSDIDGDGKSELAVVSAAQGVSIYPNTSTPGNISFSPKIDLEGTSNSFGVWFGDIDGDDISDLILSDESLDVVSILRNTSISGNISFSTKKSFPAGDVPQGLSVSDIDGDGKVDIFVPNLLSGNVSVLKNISTTSNIEFESKIDLNSNVNGARFTQMSDIDGDGIVDLLFTNQVNKSISIYKYNPKFTPAAPTNLSVTNGNGQLVISFTPGSDGRSPITNYEYKLNVGSTWVSFNPTVTSSPVTIPGLTNGTSYSVQLRAVNVVGSGAVSDPVTGTPKTAPVAPTNLVVTEKDGELEISFTPGADNGSAITNYEYQLDNGEWIPFSPVLTTFPVTIPNLTNGTLYSVKLRAVNAGGKSGASAAVTGTPFSAIQDWYVDADGDGYVGEAISQSERPTGGYLLGELATANKQTGDCNDADRAINPTTIWYLDADIDGYHTGTGVTACVSPGANYVTTTNGTDCDDTDNTKHASFNFYADTDGDGYGAGSLVSVCAVNNSTPPAGYSLNNTDCAPGDATKWQSARLYIDADGDGYDNGSSTVCYGASIPSGYKLSTSGSDCDDTNPNKRSTFGFYLDSDKDGFGAGSLVNICAFDANTPPVGYSTNNTDCAPKDATKWRSAVLFIDADNDGYTCGSKTICYGATTPAGYRATENGMDCNDKNDNVNPGKTEVCGNKIDDDCDGQVDEGCVVPCSFTTLTQSGWDATGSSSPLTNNWFAAKFPAGLTIGGTGNSARFIRLTSAAAVRVFLPSSGVANILTQSSTNPTNTSVKNVFAGELVALTLNIALHPDLGNARIKSGPYINRTVNWLLAEANLKISSTTTKSAELKNLSDAFSKANSSFGKTKTDYVACDNVGPIATTTTNEIEVAGNAFEFGTAIDKTEVVVYPNPSSNHFTIKNTGEVVIHARVLTASGQAVELLNQIQPGQTKQFGHNLKGGVYLLEIEENGNRVVTKLMKLN